MTGARSELAVVAEDIVLKYDGADAIGRSSFEIPAGAITALIGPNGSGKSTLLHAIAGLLRPIIGSLEIRPVAGRPRRLAYVLQTTKVNDALPITVREVVAMGRYASRGPYGWLRAPDRAAIDDAMDRMKVRDLANRHLRDLSGGQRQRVFVAQGLAQEHDMLLLDEPLTGLDLTSARAIDHVIHDEHRRGCTIVMSTHDLAEARVADHVVLLAGRVVASGPPDDVLVLDNLIAAYGHSLLHVEGEELVIDDPAHNATATRHLHRERTIHVETPGSEQHE